MVLAQGRRHLLTRKLFAAKNVAPLTSQLWRIQAELPRAIRAEMARELPRLPQQQNLSSAFHQKIEGPSGLSTGPSFVAQYSPSSSSWARSEVPQGRLNSPPQSLLRLLGACFVFGAPEGICPGRSDGGAGGCASIAGGGLTSACQRRCLGTTAGSDRGSGPDPAASSNFRFEAPGTLSAKSDSQLETTLSGSTELAGADATETDSGVVEAMRASAAVQHTKPKTDSEIMQDLSRLVTTRKVVLFMKGSPEKPQCGFSKRSVDILVAIGCKDFTYVDVLKSPRVRDLIKKYSSWPTIPQLYVGGDFVGGCDVITQLFQSGQLTELFAKHNALLEDERPPREQQKLATQQSLHARGAAMKPRIKAQKGDDDASSKDNV